MALRIDPVMSRFLMLAIGLVSSLVVGASCSSAKRAPATADRGSFDVRRFGAVGDGRTKDTAAFQHALDSCAASGGGEVNLGAREYVMCSIEIRTNTTLPLASRAILISRPYA